VKYKSPDAFAAFLIRERPRCGAIAKNPDVRPD
jgi:hypothetical protein